VTGLKEGEEAVGVLNRRIQLVVTEGAVKGVDAAVQPVLEEPPTLQGDVLGSAEGSATGAK
jgi:hypothetical protein